MVDVALVEDDPIIRQNYSEMLTDCGYNVVTYADRESAEIALRKSIPDIVLLDVTLESDRDAGFALCREIRNICERVIIIILSARSSDVDVISGLRLGADDYVTKDSSIDFLVARIESRLQRLASTTALADSAETELDLGSLKMSLERHECFWQGNSVDLTVTQFRMLWNICERPGQVKTPENLMSAANKRIEPNTVAVHIKGIRGAFKKLDTEFSSIRTEHGLGYRWIV